MAREDKSRQIRYDSADEEYKPGVPHPTNGEEGDYGGRFIANYSKALSHNDQGEVDQNAYIKLRDACINSIDADPSTFTDPFPNIPKGPVKQGKCYNKLTNPPSGLAFDLEGPDCHALSVKAPPRIDSEAGAADIIEVYWMALCRDIDFNEFNNNHLIQQAVNSLSQFSNFIRPADLDSPGNLSSSNIFRGNFKGDTVGPFVSQFLLKGSNDDVLGRKPKEGFVKYGAASYDNRIVVGVKDVDFMTHFDAWLDVQNGEDRNHSLIEQGDKKCNNVNDDKDLKDLYDTTQRFIHNMRALASYVHFDKLYQAYLNALIYLTRIPNKEMVVDGQPLLDPGNPYTGSHPYTANQIGFGTFGAPHILSLVTEVASRALKAAWFQKWFIHRRLRPEAFGGLIHLKKTNQKDYPIHEKILNSDVLDKIAQRNKDLNERFGRHDAHPAQDGKYYLLPQAFPEGSPTHPSFPAGHATVAGACVTVLKSWFNEDYPIKHPLHAVNNGTKLEEYNGPGKDELTLGGELNKLAANVAVGRNMSGVHYRTDYIESVKLGELLAIGILQDQRKTYFEKYSLTLKKEYRFADTSMDIIITN